MALQLSNVHYNEQNNAIRTQSDVAAYGHSGQDDFYAVGQQLSFWAGGSGNDTYYLRDFSGFVAITEDSNEVGVDQLVVSADLFDLKTGSYADDLQVFSIDHRHLVIASDSLDQKIVIADGMNNFGNIESVNMQSNHGSLTLSSSLVFNNLVSSDHFIGNFSAREVDARDFAIALDDVTHESQVVSQIEDKFADRGITWDSAKDYVTNSLDNPAAVYTAANLSGLNTEMLGVLVGVSTDTVNEYFTGNGFDPAGLG